MPAHDLLMFAAAIRMVLGGIAQEISEELTRISQLTRKSAKDHMTAI